MSKESTHVLGSIYDNKSELFWAPQLFRTKADFVRGCQTAAKDKSSMLNQHPSDFELFIVGQWNEADALVDFEQTRLGSVLDLCPLN